MTTSRKIGIIIYVIIIILNALVTSAVYINAKKKPNMYRLLLVNMTILAWLFFGIIESMSKGTDYFFIALRCTIIPVIYIGAVWLFFVVNYVEILPEKYRKLSYLLFIPPTITYIPFLVGGLEHLVIAEMLSNIKVVKWGPLFNANTTISHTYGITSLILLLRKARSENNSHSHFLLLIAVLIPPMALNALNAFNIVKYPDFDLTIVSLALYLLVIVHLVFKNRIIDVFPYASYELFSRFNDAIIITDHEGKICDFNSSTLTYFDDLMSLKNGVPISDFIDKLTSFSSKNEDETERFTNALNIRNESVFETLLSINHSVGGRNLFAVSIIPIWRSRTQLGKMIQFRDVTLLSEDAQKKERYRLSADLHDSMSNSLNVISSNLEFVLNQEKMSDESKDYIQTAYDKTIRSFFDLRRIVENLRPIDIEQHGLVWAIESFIKRFRYKNLNFEFFNNYSIEYDRNFEVEENLYYICQEAVNNSIVHGKAMTISIVLSSEPNGISLFIADDGSGCSQIYESKGLISIKERVKSMKGDVTFVSLEDGGFTINVFVPADGYAVDRMEGFR